MATTGQRPNNVLPLPRWTIIIHALQVLFAVIVLGLAAYGVHYIAYNALIYAIVCAILTFGVCGYIIGTTLLLHSLYNGYIVFGLHILMLIFWICEMGLVANLARIWADPYVCTYSYYYGYNYCTTYSDNTAVKTYYGVLTAGALVGAAELALWAISGVLVIIYLNKQRSNPANTTDLPRYTNNGQAMPMDQKFGQTGVPQQPQPVHQQPAYHQQSQYSAPPYPQDPVNRAHTVSPLSQVGYGAPPQNTSELATPQHTGGFPPNHNVSELSTQQPYPTASELSNHK